MTIKYETALQMAEELGSKAYAREFEGEKGEALRRAGMTPLTAGLTKMAVSYGLKKDPGVPVTFSHWVNTILEIRNDEDDCIQVWVNKDGATAELNPKTDPNGAPDGAEIEESGQTELEAIAKLGLRVLLKKAERDEQNKLVIAQTIPEGGKA
jgi:hypothetical protein